MTTPPLTPQSFVTSRTCQLGIHKRSIFTLVNKVTMTVSCTLLFSVICYLMDFNKSGEGVPVALQVPHPDPSLSSTVTLPTQLIRTRA